MSKYRKMSNHKPDLGLVSFACCDCGLVHLVGFTDDAQGIIRLDLIRNNRATAQLRRTDFPYLKSPQKGDLWKMVRIRK